MVCCVAVAEVAKSVSSAQAKVTEFSYDPETGKLEAKTDVAPKLGAKNQNLAVDIHMSNRIEAESQVPE